jgi:transcriptional regulator with XRE-family HTH domain
MSEIFNSIQVSDDVNRFVDHSFEVVNKIHSILENQGKTQRDLSVLLGKSESEISKWMRGTHNFTLKSISKIESVLGEKILHVIKEDEMVVKKEILNIYSSLFKTLDFTFEKKEVLEKSDNISKSYNFKEVQFEFVASPGHFEVCSNRESEEPSYDRAA